MLQTDSTETKHSQQHGVQLIEQHHEEMRQPYQVLHELPRDATPAQQDSALQTVYGAQPRVQEAVPLDSTSLLNRANAIGKLENVELPQYYKQNFFSTDSLWHPELNGGRYGIAGDPVPYTIARDNIITLLLIFCFCIALIAYTKSRRFILRQAKEFFRPPVSENMTAVTETSEELRFQFFLVLQTCLLLGLVYFFYTQLYVADTFVVDHYQVIAIFSLTVFAYMTLKTLFYWLVGWVFFNKRNNEFWMKSNLFFLGMEGVCLFPVVMLQAYFKMPVQTTLVCTFLVIALFKLLSLYKSYIIFFRHRGGFLQNFLYFCTLELAPLAALIGSLTMIANCLKVNF